MGAGDGSKEHSLTTSVLRKGRGQSQQLAAIPFLQAAYVPGICVQSWPACCVPSMPDPSGHVPGPPGQGGTEATHKSTFLSAGTVCWVGHSSAIHQFTVKKQRLVRTGESKVGQGTHPRLHWKQPNNHACGPGQVLGWACLPYHRKYPWEQAGEILCCVFFKIRREAVLSMEGVCLRS